jgi:hypothetical protein
MSIKDHIYLNTDQAVRRVGKHLFGGEWSGKLKPEIEQANHMLRCVLSSGEIKVIARSGEGVDYNVDPSLWRNEKGGRDAIDYGLAPLDLLDSLAVKPLEWKQRRILIRETDLDSALEQISPRHSKERRGNIGRPPLQGEIAERLLAEICPDGKKQPGTKNESLIEEVRVRAEANKEVVVPSRKTIQRAIQDMSKNNEN